MASHDLELEIILEIYTGLFLLAISIGYLLVRFFQPGFARGVKKDGIKATAPVRQLSNRNKQRGLPKSVSPGRGGNQTGRTLRRSALVAGSIQKPWGW